VLYYKLFIETDPDKKYLCAINLFSLHTKEFAGIPLPTKLSLHSFIISNMLLSTSTAGLLPLARVKRLRPGSTGIALFG
jgi:hypothetical protein